MPNVISSSRKSSQRIRNVRAVPLDQVLCIVYCSKPLNAKNVQYGSSFFLPILVFLAHCSSYKNFPLDSMQLEEKRIQPYELGQTAALRRSV